MRRDSGTPPGHVATMLRMFGRLPVLLAAVVAMGATGAYSAPASAGARHRTHHGHGGAIRAVFKPMRSAVRGHHQRTYARNHPFRGATRHAATVHRDVVPLANTTWDNPKVSPAVKDAIQAAARESGVDPNLLTTIAWRESRFDPDAGNRHSSAQGLLQFTTGTWLQAVRSYGAQHDLGGYAAAIQRDKSGVLVVPEKGVRAAILRLRNDPVLSAKLAADSMSQGCAAIQDRLGRNVRPADLYLLHVLGPTGAERFLTAVARHPSEPSTKVVSYDVMRNAGLLARDGRPMTVGNTYAAASAMLNAQRVRSEPPAPAMKAGNDAAPVAAIQVSAAP